MPQVVGISGIGPRQKGFEAIGIVPLGDQLATQSWGGTLGLKRQGPAMQMCLCGYRGDLHSTCPLGIYLISL